MQDNDFDKIFSHKFDQLPGAPYREEGWSELSQRLDRSRSNRWVLPLFLPLFGLLAGGNIFWWYQWKESTRAAITPGSEITVLQPDTIVRKTVIYQYDTIYRHTTVVRYETRLTALENNSTGESAASSASSGERPQPANGRNEADNSQVVEYSTSKSPAGDQITASPTGAVATVPEQIPSENTRPAHTIVHKVAPDSSLLAAATPITEIPSVSDTIFEDLLKKQPEPTKKSQPPLIYLARPRIGVSAFWARPHIEDQLSGSVLGAGIRGDVEIARNFRLGAEITFLQGSLKAEETEALEAVDVDIPQPGGDFRLKYWETYFLPAFSYALNLRYEIPVRGNWKPWISTGIQACSSLPFEVEFEFENDNNSLELHVPARAEATTRMQGVTFAAGVECPLSEHFRFGLEAGMLRSFSEESGLLDRQTGLKTTLWYAF